MDGDIDTFSIIIDEFGPQILRYCNRMLNFHPQDAEDCCAQTFVNVYKNIGKFDKKLNFSSWIYRIAHNNCVDLIKTKSNLFYFDFTEFIPQIGKYFIESPDDKLDFKLKREKIEKGLGKLNPTEKSLIILFHFEEKSLAEIGEIYKLATNTVAVKLKRAREKLKKLI